MCKQSLTPINAAAGTVEELERIITELRASQLRLFFASLAYAMVRTLREVGLEGTALAKAQCNTIRLRLLELAAHVRVTVRNVWVSFSRSYPYAGLLGTVHQRLRAPP